MEAINKKPEYESPTIAIELQLFGMILLFSLLELSLYNLVNILVHYLWNTWLYVHVCISVYICVYVYLFCINIETREVGGEREDLKWLGSSHLV